MGNVIIIDDDVIFRDLLATHCELLEHTTLTAATVEEGKALLTNNQVDLVFLDVRLPDGNGLDLLPFIKKIPCSPEVVIITGMGDAEGAELAITNGAWDYLRKPLSRQEIILHIRRAFEYHSKKMQRATFVNLKREGIIGESEALRNCLDQVAHCAEIETGVLITGDTGTGKEVFARAIHANSSRANRPFVVVDCASLPEQIIESILFGHVKGAFTGAYNDQKGLIEQADGGTLFLDEVGELPLETQKTFLRVLQERVFRPVGKDREHKSNFRLIAATNRNLSEFVTSGAFRSDLYFRLNTFNIHLPPLREREKDIDKLAMHCVFKFCQRNKLPIKGVLPETLDILTAYPWPGNVRELENVLEKAIVSDPENSVIYPVHLPLEIRLHHVRAKDFQVPEQVSFNFSQSSITEQMYSPTHLPPLKEYRRILNNNSEKHYLKRLMKETEGDISAACSISELRRSRLYGLLKFHGLSDPE